MVARPVSLGRRDSGTTPAPKIKQAVKMVDENAVFCDSISEFMTDNQDFLVVGVCGLQVRKKEMLLTGKQMAYYSLLPSFKFTDAMLLRTWGRAP